MPSIYDNPYTMRSISIGIGIEPQFDVRPPGGT